MGIGKDQKNRSAIFKRVFSNDLIRLYIFDPVNVCMRKSAEYVRDLLYSIILVPKLHKNLLITDDSTALKQSRGFLLKSIAFASILISFIAFVPETPATSRTEMLGKWGKSLLMNLRVALLFCVQSVTVWWFLKRRITDQLSTMKIISLLAYFIGGPAIIMTALCHSIEFGIPTTKIAQVFTSVLQFEGTMGILVILIGSILLCLYFWPYLKKPKYTSLVIAVAIWHAVLVAAFAMDAFVMKKPIIANIKEALTEHNYQATSAVVRKVAEEHLKFWLTSMKVNGRPPTFYEQIQIEPCFDSWNRSIIHLLYTYQNTGGTLQPYSFVVSKGPNGLLDITESDLMRMDFAFRTRRFHKLEDVDAFVDSICSAYNPVPIPVADRKASTTSLYGPDSWVKVDIFGTMGVPHDQWSAIMKGAKVE